MPDSSRTDPAPEDGRRASRATTREYPKSHRAPDETDETEAPTESAVEDFPEEAPRSTKRRWKFKRGSGSRWPTFAALAIALIAAAIGIGGWFLPFNPASHFNAQQTAAAKANVCSAYAVAHRAVVINTHLVNPRRDDPIGSFAMAANARLALLGGGAYLRDRLAAEPAAPADLAKTLTYMADTIEQLGINYLADAPNVDQNRLRSNLDKEIKAIDQLCA
jgi:hypothetical protein